MAKKYLCEPVFVTKAYKWQLHIPPELGAVLLINVLFTTVKVTIELMAQMAPVNTEL